MVQKLQNLNDLEPIVNLETGAPTPYFMRMLRKRGFLQDEVEDRLDLLEGITINTTAPIEGGGATLGDGLDFTFSYVDVAASKLVGRGSAAGDGAPVEITPGTGLAITGTTLDCTVVGLSDGDKGDITVSASGATWTVDNAAITFAKIQNVTAARLLGRTSASTGAPQEITPSTGLTLSGTDLTVTIPLTDGDKGDITVSSTGTVFTIDNDAVTFAKMQNLTANRVIGRTEASGGDPQELTPGPGLVIVGTDIWAGGADINTQTGTSYTAVMADKDGYIRFTNAAAIAFTVPPNSSVAFRVGTVLTVRQAGAGQITLTPGAGVTLSSFGASLTTAGQHATVQMKKVATDTWDVIGHVT